MIATAIGAGAGGVSTVALAGRRFEAPKPLTTGADAKTLHERAQEWAARRATGRRG
jgi:hypothetical protein